MPIVWLVGVLPFVADSTFFNDELTYFRCYMVGAYRV